MDKRSGDNDSMDTNPFWNYTLEVYGVDRVRDIVLRWQDDYGCDVNMILCCCWLAGQRQRLSDDQLAELQRVGAQWRSQCLLPLRNIRRYVKPQANTASLYRQLKDAEINAEKWQQLGLFQCAEGFALDPSLDGSGVGVDNLQGYCQLLSGVEWSDLAEEATELQGLLKL
jgi:uncharacterized protein (TIGR02444 family)